MTPNAATVRPVYHFGGNGHAAIRLAGARAALARQDCRLALADVPYPGFEGRPRAGSLDAFLDDLIGYVRPIRPRAAGAIASGIGALIALSLRARGELDRPLILQSPVLWGLESRAMPRLMRWRLPRAALGALLACPPYQRHFVRRQFLRDPGPALRSGFFEGYARCSAFGDFFAWFTPPFLRDLERRFADHPDRLGAITVWCGGRDRVVGPAELVPTERALGVRWPVDTFPDWGHYPAIDHPDAWAEALCHALAV